MLAISHRGDAELIAGTMRALIGAKPRLWLMVDVSTRRSLWHAPQWTEAVADRLGAGHAGPLDLLLAACHPDGFVREAALDDDTMVVLPTLALRAADWVPELRDRARQVCRRYLNRAPAEAIVSLAPVALALRARQAGAWLADAIDGLLRDGPPEAIAAALASEDWRVRRNAHAIVLGAGRLSVEQMVHAATADGDLPVRIMCAQAAIRAARAMGDHETPRRLLGSGTAAVRAEAVCVLGEVGAAIEALDDRSALVRATAQTIARRAGTDPAVRYRALLAEQRPPNPAVIAGLGETGIDSDIDLLRPWLAHPSSRGRAETVRALRRRGCTSPDLLLPRLTDAVSSVTRQVTLSLSPHASSLDERALRPLLDPSQTRHVRQAAHRLLRARDTWTRISVDLRLINDPEHAIRADARADLANWLTRDAATTYSFPSGSRADELSALVTGAEAVLGQEQTRLLRFHLGLPG
ncbi:hypothetical protein ALI144C_22940 [Actinosynnema sp. ALI-1.44]|nr:hypothetical protein ALI144C_22940 [Actinosynnema sp. ALI-1.44]